MIGGKKHRACGSRAEVFHGSAKHTSGGLTKGDLMKNKHGRIVSRKKHATAKKDNRLAKAGYKTKKGHFGYIKDGHHSTKKRKYKGGMNHPSPGQHGSSYSGSNSSSSSSNSSNSSSNHSHKAAAIAHHKNQSGGRRHRKSKHHRRSRKHHRGGMSALSPANYSGKGQGLNTPSVDVQFQAGNSG